jgi:Arc/MetJ-type ribon-helix-helix transcriptional regulator
MAEETFDMPYSVDLFLPPHWEQRLEALVSAGEAYASIERIHAALWQMRGSEMTHEERRAELEAAIVAGLDSGPGVEVTPEFWEAFKRKCEARHDRITVLMQQHGIGNTLLPEKLYRYIQDKMASGAFPTPTAVVCEALNTYKPFESIP